MNIVLGNYRLFTNLVHYAGKSHRPIDPCTRGTIIINVLLDSLYIVLARFHYVDVTMTTVASQITSLAAVYSTVYSGAHVRKHQSSASLAFVRGIHRDRWIPRTNGQLRGKCFHLMTLSCCHSITNDHPCYTHSPLMFGFLSVLLSS